MTSLAERLSATANAWRRRTSSLSWWSVRQQRTVAAWAALGLALLSLQAVLDQGRVERFEKLAREPVELRIDINRASWPELMVLPGISEVRAQRIVRWREQHGPFRSVEDLQKVHGIGPTLVQRLQPWVEVVGGAAEP